MKKMFSSLILAAALVLPFAGAQAAESAASQQELSNPAGNPVDQFTGEYWIKSTLDNKEAFLFGIDTAVAIENFINSSVSAKAVHAGKKPVSTLSPFARGWMTAFKDMTRKQIVTAVDDWYAAHPDQLNRPVLSVIWYEVIVPRLDKK